MFGPVVGPDGLLFGKFTAVSVSRSAAFLVIVVVMVVGGRSLPLRSTLLDRLPAVGQRPHLDPRPRRSPSPPRPPCCSRRPTTGRWP